MSVVEIKKMIPKGYVVLTESGAREALKAKINAVSFEFQLSESKKIIAIKDTIIKNQNIALDELKAASTETKKALKSVKGKVFWNTVEIWGYRILLIYFGGKAISK